MLTEKITPVIITLDEAANIDRTLNKLRWANRIVVIDSGSTDGTLDIVRRYPAVEVFQHPFKSFAAQCNFGLAQVHSDWVLSLDADYELSDELVQELSELKMTDAVAGYNTNFIYRIYGRPLRGTLYPARTVLYRTTSAHYHDVGHGHKVAVSGNLAQLRGVIFHDDRKSLARWFHSQVRYASTEAEYLLMTDRGCLPPADRVRLRGWPAPFLAAFYVLFAKGCLLDGWAGWFYTLQRVLAEVVLALAILDKRLRRSIKDEQ